MNIIATKRIFSKVIFAVWHLFFIARFIMTEQWQHWLQHQIKINIIFSVLFFNFFITILFCWQIFYCVSSISFQRFVFIRLSFFFSQQLFAEFRFVCFLHLLKILNKLTIDCILIHWIKIDHLFDKKLQTRKLK